jgi:protoporphyrinogen oxidase
MLPPREVVILGAGLAGLSVGYVLSKAGRKVIVLEKDTEVGGLAKTIIHNGFRFDLGGHRFITGSKKIEQFVVDILKGDVLLVERKSKIYLLKRYFDYPLRPLNAIFGLGPGTTLQIIWDYGKEKIKQMVKPPLMISLEDWVVNQFGRKMFDLYFKQYSEKVWGMDCGRISQEWVAQRIRGLSLWEAIRNAFLRSNGRDLATLSDRFIYPPKGIGQISERLRDGIEEENRLLTKTMVMEIRHGDSLINDAVVRHDGHVYQVKGNEFVSTIPLTRLLHILNPAPPQDILDAASRLKYRDIIVVAIMLHRAKVTENNWIYLPEKEIPFGRIHEPPNWSPHMAPKGQTHLGSEYFCCKGDEIWHLSDEELASMTIEHLEKLGFIHKSEVIDSCVMRAANAYPVFEVGYWQPYNKILQYLSRFKNLHISGRAGMFRYYNMDHAMGSGIDVAQEILRKHSPQEQISAQRSMIS